MNKSDRMRLAFEGWWGRNGHQLGSTPVPDLRVRFAIAKIAFESGWKARSDRAQKKVLRADDAEHAARKDTESQV